MDRAQTGHGNIGCCLCIFIVVSVIVGVAAVTSISFVAFFQADFHSYELVYQEAAEFLNTDIVHTSTLSVPWCGVPSCSVARLCQ